MYIFKDSIGYTSVSSSLQFVNVSLALTSVTTFGVIGTGADWRSLVFREQVAGTNPMLGSITLYKITT